MAPILPALSDDPGRMAAAVRAARDAGATSIWTNVLYLRPATREHFLDNLARDWPELRPRYEALYAGRASVSKEVLNPASAKVAELPARYGIEDRRAVRLEPVPEPEIEQLPLAAYLPAPGHPSLGAG